MSISILNRGASGGLKPELTVTAPSGSVIDIMQGGIIVATYTLGADETEHTFVVKIGTYTVRGTLGTLTKSVEVVIDIVGQYAVTIEYVLWLYREGDECENITGGWSQGAQNANSGSITKNADSITLYSNNVNSGRGIATNSTVDVTGYSKACMVVDISTSNEGGCFGHWGFTPVRTWSGSTPDGAFGSSKGLYGYNLPAGSVKQGQNILLEFSFDKSVSYYPYVQASAGAGANQTIVLKQMWLE